MKYEYLIINSIDLHVNGLDAVGELNKMGQEGWELCCKEDGIYTFKRQLPNMPIKKV